MAYKKIACMAAVAMLAGSAHAAVEYDFSSISAGSGVIGSFSVTVPTFLTANTTFTPDQVDNCTSTPATACGRNQTFYTDTSPLVSDRTDNYDGVGAFGGVQYYFQNGALGTYGTYTSLLFSTQVANLTIRQVPDRTTGAVPEPASWAMMIVGFGAIGGALRRRRLAFTYA